MNSANLYQKKTLESLFLGKKIRIFVQIHTFSPTFGRKIPATRVLPVFQRQKRIIPSQNSFLFREAREKIEEKHIKQVSYADS